MNEKPPENISKKNNKMGELIRVDFEKGKIVYRSGDIDEKDLTPEEEEKIIMDTEKFKADFFRWLDGLILRMKYKFEEINGLLTIGGQSHILQYERYLYLKNDSAEILNDSKADFLGSFSPEEKELFKKIETQEMLFKEYLKTFFKVKNEWESALEDMLAGVRKKGGVEQLAKKLQAYLNNLKINYGELEKLEESKIIKKLEEFMEKNIEKRPLVE